MISQASHDPIVERLAAFSHGEHGGNPAGVVISEALPPPDEMQAIAKDVGYSETAFAAKVDDSWRVRYFAPEIEVPFCGHATIALGAALATRHGNRTFHLHLNEANITVEGHRTDDELSATLLSPPTRSMSAAPHLIKETLELFGYRQADLDRRLPPAIAEAGARHLVIALSERRSLAGMRYDFAQGRSLMLENGFATISLVVADGDRRFHSRNPFAAGGIYEDPATGAAAAALAGYLRDVRWPHGGSIEIAQGDDMGVPCRLFAEISDQPGEGIRVSGRVRSIVAG